MNKARTVSDLGEKRLIRELIVPLCGKPKTGIGIGDDAAMIDLPEGTSLLISMDKIPEDLLALQLGLMSPFEHGRYLAEVNISDIAAMGGWPLGLLASFALPNDFSLDYLEQFIRGFVSGGEVWNTPVIGGDIGRGTVPRFTATIVGCVEKNKVLTRSGASVGDRVFVTGHIGGFGTALAYFAAAKKYGLNLTAEHEKYLHENLVRPRARVDIARFLAKSGVCTSCMDITDGLRQTLIELGEASGVSFMIDEDRLPVHPSTLEVAEFLKIEPYEIVFGIGLDLQLAGTLSCGLESLPAELSNQLTVIGSVSENHQHILRLQDGKMIPLPGTGWQHFAEDAMSLVLKSYGSLKPPPRRG